MNFWQAPSSQTPMSAQTGYAMSNQVPEEQFTQKLPKIYDQPGYGEAFAALTQANQQVRLHHTRRKNHSK